MALDTLDTIRDAAINQGIGNSGLTSQAIQRSNIEDLKSLRGALAEAQSIRNEEDRLRQPDLSVNAIQRLKAMIPTQKTGLKSGEGNALKSAAPSALIYENAGSYSIRIPGQSITPTFRDINDIENYLRANPEIAKTIGLSGVSNDSMQLANRLGIPFVRVADQNKFLGTSPANNIAFGGSAVKVSDVQTPEAKALETMSKNPAEFSIKDLNPNTAAKMISGYYDRLTAQASKGLYTYIQDPSGMSVRADQILKGALATGNGRSAYEALVRSGYAR